jgi:ABC-type sugar transport system substrate-binding protein
LLISLAAAQVQAQPALRIGGVTQLASDPFFITLMCGATKEAKALGAVMEWRPIQGVGAQDLAANLDAVALTKPDAILISANPALSPRMGQLMAEGTPVVAVNVKIRPATAYADVVSEPGSKEFTTGVAGQVGTSGTVAILGGIAGSETLAARYQPFIDAMKEMAPNVKVLDPQFEKLNRTNAAAITSALLLANPDLKAVFAVAGPPGAGAASAIAQMGKTDQVKVFTYDATPEVVQGLKTGTITAALAQAPAKMGAIAVRTAIERAKRRTGGAVVRDESKNVNIPLKILTKENVSTPEAADYLYFSECK